MGYVVSVAPSSEPLLLAEAKAHLRVDHSDEDDLITALIVAARIAIENYLDQKLITQTIIEYFDAFPTTVIPLTFWPVASITSIQYLDSDGTEQTWGSANYTTDIYGQFGEGPARITPAYSVSYPSTRDVVNSVYVTYVAGYGAAAAVPALIKSAMYLLITDLYDGRGERSTGALFSRPSPNSTRWQSLLNVGGYKKIL